jgi:CheY-like chemotaxis protein
MIDMNMAAISDIDILLVDDDDVAAEGVLRSLRKCPVPFRCVTAVDGREGLEILRGVHPEKAIRAPMFVLLDLNMPRMNGFEFLTSLRADPGLHDTVVFVLTTSNRETDRAESYHDNIAGYMVKSEVGPQFTRLAELLASYARSIKLPAFGPYPR